LGKVQSGKTSHLLGTLAYASKTSFALASIFTGVNNALNEQGLGRVQGDLSEKCIKVFSVPTSSASRSFENLLHEVAELIETRANPSLNNLGISRPLPVLVTMKNPKRVAALAVLIEKLSEMFGKSMSYLMIDDEADQASQNAKAQKSEMAATYSAISQLRTKEIRHVMLSYTATPQAVLLAEQNGNLRPDRCVTVPPRHGYFGLNEIVEEEFKRNLIHVDDVLLGANGNPSTWRKTPDSLRNALINFYLCALIRHFWPKVFYSKSSLPFDQLEDMDSSTQMMFHQSVNVREHSAIFGHIKSARNDLLTQLLSGLTSGRNVKSIDEVWTALKQRRVDELVDLPAKLTEDHYKKLYETISSTQMKIVNGDRTNETADVEMPVTSSEWESHETWILIGGEILGRGLTIPQLTTTYFLRTAKKSNFDTVSQQMRFCGYREPYSHMVTLHAPSDTLEKFVYMRAIESTVWRYAKRWDDNRTDISSNIPPILYAAPLSANLEPTRKNVRDPFLVDQKVDKKGNILRSLVSIFDPSDVYTNLKTLQSWLISSGVIIQGDPNSAWASMESVSATSFKSLLSSWVSGDDPKGPLRSMAELFSAEMEELGLGTIPISIFVKKGLIEPHIFSDPVSVFRSSEAIDRAVKPASGVPPLEEWLDHFGYEGNSKKWPDLQSPHVGSTQRNVFASLPYTASALIIEPVLGHAHKSSSTKLGYGLALTLFKPKEYEVRMMGHA
jgi:hypothetical protein